MKLLYVLAAVMLLAGCGKKGKDGAPGPQGPAGPKGEQGATGPQGANGADATLPPYVVVGIIDPCGDAPGVVDEVLLKLANGQVLVSFSQNSSGLNTRFAILPPGSYMTTDGSNCAFTLDNSGNIH